MIILNVSPYKSGGTWLNNILSAGLIDYETLDRAIKRLEIESFESTYFEYKNYYCHFDNYKKLNRAINIINLDCEQKIFDKIHFYAHIDDEAASMILQLNCKFVLMQRDYRDVVVSRYYHEVASGREDGSFTEFFDKVGLRLLDEAWKYDQFWKKISQQGGDVLFIDYAEFKTDFRNQLEVIQNVVGESNFSIEKAVTLESIESNRKYKTVEWMRKFQDSGGDFYRKGEIGDYIEHFNEKNIEQYEVWLRKQEA